MSKIVYMGTPEYAKIILQKLLDSKYSVELVLTQPDRPVGRKKVLTSPPVKELALSRGIEVAQPSSLKNSDILKKIEAIKPDFIVVAAYGQLLPKAILDIAPSINLHASILPKYRGASPIQQALLNGDEYSGVTAMLMEEGLDSGDMLGFKYIKSSKAPRLDEMFIALSNIAADLTIDILDNFNNINPIPQLNALASKCKKIKREDGLVNFDSAKELYRKYCAYFGWPGIFLENGMKLHDITLLNTNSQNKEGEILEINDEFIDIGCKNGAIRVGKIQPKSKAKMDAKAYTLGQRLKVGDTLLW